MSDRPVLNPDEQCTLEQVEKSLKYLDGRYQVALPWKENDPDLPDNYGMALSRLCNTEKRLLKSPEIVAPTQKTSLNIWRRAISARSTHCNRRKTNKEMVPATLSVVRLDKVTTKTRIVFDASAKFSGIPLNEVIHQGPKLQRFERCFASIQKTPCCTHL